ncbi:unnamed protein product [Caenorhabditis nigoni]
MLGRSATETTENINRASAILNQPKMKVDRPRLERLKTTFEEVQLPNYVQRNWAMVVTDQRVICYCIFF